MYDLGHSTGVVEQISADIEQYLPYVLALGEARSSVADTETGREACTPVLWVGFDTGSVLGWTVELPL